MSSVISSRRSDASLRIAFIGSARFGVGEPFAGGLESHTATTVRALQRSGHDVTLFAGPADAKVPEDLDVVPIMETGPDFADVARPDQHMSAESTRRMDIGYQRLLDRIGTAGRFDVVHNNSLHFLPVLADGHIGVPMIHVLHCPPFADLTTAHDIRRRSSGAANLGDVVAVSSSLAQAWNDAATAVVTNGICVAGWSPRPGDVVDRCVWAGRIVEEKAPHLAIDAARCAGRPIVLAGPVQHRAYFDEFVRPRLGPDAQWFGHLDRRDLANLYATSAVGVVTPQWDEPFGLVVAEMLASGAPVAAIDRGAIASILTPMVGRLAHGNDVDDLAAAIDGAAALDRAHCRTHARRHLSDTAMVGAYLRLYRRSIERAGGNPARDSPDELAS